jgi:hypothetical protein
MLTNHKTARAMWAPPLQPITWEQFKAKANKDAHAEANLEQIRECAKTADAETLREIVGHLVDRVAGAEFAAKTNHDTVVALWSKKR